MNKLWHENWCSRFEIQEPIDWDALCGCLEANYYA